MTTQPIPADWKHLPVCHCLTNGDWNLNVLGALLPPNMLRALPTPLEILHSSTGPQDMETKDGNYSVASAYTMKTWEKPVWHAAFIWKMRLSP